LEKSFPNLGIKKGGFTMKDYRQEFKKLLKEMRNQEISAETKQKAKEIFQAIDAKTLGLLEQELIQESVSREEIRKSLCDIHLEVLQDTLVKKRIEVKSPHPVHTLMEEHKVILESLNDLGRIVEEIRDKNSFEEMGEDLEKLQDIAHHLVEAESHHQREEEILFPKLAAHGIKEPPEIMKMDHIEFRERKKNLYQLAHNYQDHNFPTFKEKVMQLGSYLTKELEGHIFKEDNLLYQIALQVLTEEEWEEVKKESDKIGYCCFTPAE
jgi:hypothetical protein